MVSTCPLIRIVTPFSRDGEVFSISFIGRILFFRFTFVDLCVTIRLTFGIASGTAIITKAVPLILPFMATDAAVVFPIPCHHRFPSVERVVFGRLEGFNRTMLVHPVRVRRAKVVKAADATLFVLGCTTATTGNRFLAHGRGSGLIEPEGVSLSMHSSLWS